MESIESRFDRIGHEDPGHCEFGKIQHKRSQRPDLHAFLLLDEVFPSPGNDMVSAAEHDQIWLAPDEELLDALSDAQILELIRCGVMVSEYGGLCMFS